MSDAAIFRPASRTRLTEQLTSHLRRQIVSGGLGFNRKLPPMRRLAKLYGVSEPTLYAAIHALAALGLVRVEWGVGVYVRRPRTNAAVLDHAWRDATPVELAMLMAALNERLPSLAARGASSAAGRRVIRKAADLIFLARERSALGRLWSAEAFVDADLAFHRAVARLPASAEGAPILFDWVCRRIRPSLLAVAGEHAADDRLDRAHLELAEAIAGADQRRAERAARLVARREARAIVARLG
jgi:DNA-binding FadR family transcriptional regulator